MTFRFHQLITSPYLIQTLLASAVLISLVSNLGAAPCARTVAEQDVWVLNSVDQLVHKARAAYEDEKSEKAYGRLVDKLTKTMKHCRMTADASFVNRYPDFVEYVRVLSLDRQKGHELGFEVSDKVYFEETKSHVTIPDFLLTPEFLQAVRRYETLDQAKSILRTPNTHRSVAEQLLFFSFESRHLGTPDNDFSYKRLLIVVPGDSAQNVPEKWIQFGIPDPKSKATIRNMSVVAVLPGPDQSSNTYFKDYFRTYRGNGTVTVKGRWELGYGDDNCVKCHKSGVLPIFPEAGSVSEDEKAVVEVVNKRFLQYGAPRFGRYLDASKFGPGLGTTRPSAPGHATPSFNCSSCHQPGGLGSLNWPMDSVLISSFVESGRMPFGTALTGPESTQLYQQLIDDYFAIDEKRPGILKSWLLGKSR